MWVPEPQTNALEEEEAEKNAKEVLKGKRRQHSMIAQAGLGRRN